MRTQPVPLPDILICTWCNSEFSVNSTSKPQEGATCNHCEKGVLMAPKGEGESERQLPD